MTEYKAQWSGNPCSWSIQNLSLLGIVWLRACHQLHQRNAVQNPFCSKQLRNRFPFVCGYWTWQHFFSIFAFREWERQKLFSLFMVPKLTVRTTADVYLIRVSYRTSEPDAIATTGLDAAAGRGAPSHTARNTLDYMRRENANFIRVSAVTGRQTARTWSSLEPGRLCGVGSDAARSEFIMVDSLKRLNSWSRSSTSSGALCLRTSSITVGPLSMNGEYVVQQNGGHFKHRF